MDDLESVIQESITAVATMIKSCRDKTDTEIEVLSEVFVRYMIRKAREGGLV